MTYHAGKYDVAVVGAGHAGIEAALAAARLGCSTAVFMLNMDAVGNLPCNPSIGGSSKGHLVREIDALGGAMGKIADLTTLQSRMLNRGKGPAVHSPRAQVDRRLYSAAMKSLLEGQVNLHIRQAEIIAVEPVGKGYAITTRLGAVYTADCVILATGTFLAGRIHIGDCSYDSGPDGMFPAVDLAKSLKKMGLPLRRFKTGTPPRIHRASVDFSKLELQEGEMPPAAFSFSKEEVLSALDKGYGTKTNPLIPNFSGELTLCHIGYTTEKTAETIRQNIYRSPLYSGKIEGTGPRYCPSIEDKITRFPDKKRHQIFLEPCGEDTQELYLQGVSSSLPEDVQIAVVRSIEGLENAVFTRPAYAIEYDCVDPLAMNASLEFLNFPRLFGAGQFNGSSGYEEAAAQGLLAGINAARKVMGKPPVILPRSNSYIGTLADDLVTKGCSDPYRMMTARSEYRLLLRQDNADRRLTPLGYEIGLVNEERYDKFREKLSQIQMEKQRAAKLRIPCTEQLKALCEDFGQALQGSFTLEQLLKRPRLTYENLAPFDQERPELPAEIFEAVEIDIKYAGYIARQEAAVHEASRLEEKQLPANIDYAQIGGLRLEAQEKLAAARPQNLGQAGRISGVTPADVAVLIVWLGK
ncbi:MAG: tRNA uridine-5-carboxymethylaminomethyl(34) synthesis enzyme MnmG [Oscillospiraceae bacterium]|nr:tRNA uridine-5-carboxymethylaminomethyl(34) synthesis enzyme MnmG [Oscillospiraceae bacterium]